MDVYHRPAKAVNIFVQYSVLFRYIHMIELPAKAVNIFVQYSVLFRYIHMIELHEG